MRSRSLAFGLLATCLCFGFFQTRAIAQICPPNIDFENGDFNGWKCYIGRTASIGGQNVITLNETSPDPNHHQMFTANSGAPNDPYGDFPVNCPNGSGYSIKLGNTSGGGQAEGVSYEFTIPAGQNNYSLIYYYAVVFQQPNHQHHQQPRMEIEISNLSDQTTVGCASFTFIAQGSSLPGFNVSPTRFDTIPVLYKDWTAASIDLSGLAGKRIQLFFKTADCTFQRHFGYAYIDVNTECDGKLVGATYCKDDTAVNVVAPYGYAGYTWYDSTLTNILGSQQVLTLKPPPPSGTIFSVKLEPYNGYGCPQTLQVELKDTLSVKANAGPDKVACNNKPEQIGSPPKPGLVYEWSPTRGLSNPYISNPLANPTINTTYIVTARNSGGGCANQDTVIVIAALLDDSLQLVGKDNFCIGSGDSAVLVVQPTDTIRWYKNNVVIAGANKPTYKVTATGEYHAVLKSKGGCTLTTKKRTININSVPTVAFAANTPNQCLVGNQFIFANNSTNAVGSMQYQWTFGDGNISPVKDAQHSYATSGTYQVKLIVNSSTVCKDSLETTIQVYQNAMADFSVKPTCMNLPVQIINNTYDTLAFPAYYIWNLGNGQMSTLRNPVPPVFPITGNFTISLSVYTDQCPFPYVTQRKVVTIDKPRPAISYPIKYALIDYPLPLQARNFGISALWSPGTFLNTPASYNPVFTGLSEQLYKIAITTSTGCLTVDTQVVKTVKEIMIFVPTAFTPNSDGKNDFLRPILMGIDYIKTFQIYNRWGQMVYQTTKDQPGWNGMVGGITQGTQTYVWFIEAIGVDGKTYSKKGTSLLLR